MLTASALLWLLACGTVGLPGARGDADDLRTERKCAYRHGEFLKTLDLVEKELAALGEAPAALRRLCEAIETGVHVCSEKLPELQCEDGFLRRYASSGCAHDPLERARFHHTTAAVAFRRMNFAGALQALQRGVEAAWPLLFASVLRADPASEGLFFDVVLDLAAMAALRAEIAANLRSRPGLEAALSSLMTFLEVLDTDTNMRDDAAALRSELAWGLLVLRESGVDVADPSPLLESSLATFADAATFDRPAADNVRINLALADLQRGAIAEARERLAHIERAGPSPEERLWLSLVHLRIALAQKDVRLAERWQGELARPEIVAHTPMGAWFSAWTRGLVYEARGEPALAIEAYREAEATLENLAHGVDATAPGSTADRRYLMFSGAARRLVALLIETQDTAAALMVARDARNRALRMHARPSCTLAGRTRDDPPPPGALHLFFFPRDDATGPADAGWFGLAATATEVRAVPLALAPLPDGTGGESPEVLRRWSEQMLKPFERELADAGELTVFPSGALHSVPFHALPWDNGIVLDELSVRYGLDVSVCGTPALDDPGRPGLVVSGGDYSLRVEGDAVAAILRGSGRAIEHRSATSRAPFIELLSGRYWMAHLAAHGQHPADEVMFAADVLLAFDDGTDLKRDEILAADAVPALVFLSACRSSFADGDTLGGGLNLAHAFLVRGARFVIGAERDIDAGVTRTFAQHFYRELAAGDPVDVAEAWRAAYLAARTSLAPSLQADLRMLRLFTP